MGAEDTTSTTAATAKTVAPGHWFTTTHWSVVAGAAEPGSPDAALALEQLCTAYRPPLLTYVRRAGYGPEDAEDLVQGFFTWLIERNPLRAADPLKGRFRSFLLGTLKHFLADERKHRHALKRGGGHAPVSLDAPASGAAPGGEPAVASTAESDYDRQWALTLLGHSVAALRDEYAARGKGELFEALRGFQLAGTPGDSYAALAARLGLTEAALKSAIHRLRERHAELLRAEVARTVAGPAEVDGELRHLITLLSH